MSDKPSEAVELMFEVLVKNEILGDSKKIMSMEKLMTYNVCALACAKQSAKDGKPHTWGMWTVCVLPEAPHV